MGVPMFYAYERLICSDTKPDPIYYRVRLLDDELTGHLEREAELEGDGFVLTYEGDENNILARIIASSVQINFVVNNQEDEDWINVLAEFQ